MSCEENDSPSKDVESQLDSKLHDFAYNVSTIVNLEHNKKYTPEEAYKRIKKYWKSLKKDRKEIVGTKPSMKDDIVFEIDQDHDHQEESSGE